MNARSTRTMNACGPDLFRDGWCRFDFDPALADWIAHALPEARRAVAASENARWLRYCGTWFAGVNVLENDSTGAVTGGPPLSGTAVDFIRGKLDLAEFAWDRAQVSVCYPGYPKPMPGESAAVFRFRKHRDAAHVDGLRREGETRRRFIAEHHGFLFGIPLTEASSNASPFVIWRDSHEKIRAALRAAVKDIPPASWSKVDVTEVYHAARREIFDTCERVEITARPGECYLVHRLALHGVAPWRTGAAAGPDGRMIAYFRPEGGEAKTWLERR